MWEMSGLSMMFNSPAVNSLRSRSSNFMGSRTCSNLRYSCGHNCGKKVLLSLNTWRNPDFSPRLPAGRLKSSATGLFTSSRRPYLVPTCPRTSRSASWSRNSRSLSVGWGSNRAWRPETEVRCVGAACLWTDAGTGSTRRVRRKSSLIFRTSDSSWAFRRLTSSAPSNCACLRASSSCSSDSAMSVSTSAEATPTCWFAPAMELSDITETSESESSSVGTTGVCSFTPCECNAA